MKSVRVALLLLGFAVTVSRVAADVLTFHNDSSRTGLNPNEIALTPSNVNAASFGLKANPLVDGQVYAQPLYASSVPVTEGGVQTRANLLIVATENDSVYAFDADSMTQVWKTSLLGAGEIPADDRGCGIITPENGVTGTPVIDRGIGPFGQIYVIGMTKLQGTSTYSYRLHALNLSTGQEVAGSPVTIQATFPGTFAAGTTFNPAQQIQRAALLLTSGNVYAAWAGFCEGVSPYAGWIMAYNEKTLAQTAVLSLNPNGRPVAAGSTLPAGSGAGVWGSGGALAGSPFGTIYFATGNGPFDTTLDVNGFPQSRCFGDSFLKLSSTLSILDYFTPFNQAQAQQEDVDLGSGGPLVVPQGAPGVGNAPALVIGAGKDGNIYVLNRGNLGKFHPSFNNVYQEFDGAVLGGSFGSPAFFNGALYYCGGGIHLTFHPKIRRYTFTGGQPGGQAGQLTGPTSYGRGLNGPPGNQGFGFPGTTPSVSASGTSNGIVWAHEFASDGSAVLHAYDALNLGNYLYDSTQASSNRDHIGTAVKFVTPTICNGHVYVGTANSVAAFGLLTPVTGGNVISSVQVTRGALQYQPTTGLFVQSVTLKNIGGTNLNLPLSLVLDNLSNNAALSNASGATSAELPSGSFYINAPLTSPLAPGQSVTVGLTFIDTTDQSNPQAASISYNPRVIVGAYGR